MGSVGPKIAINGFFKIEAMCIEPPSLVIKRLHLFISAINCPRLVLPAAITGFTFDNLLSLFARGISSLVPVTIILQSILFDNSSMTLKKFSIGQRFVCQVAVGFIPMSLSFSWI